MQAGRAQPLPSRGQHKRSISAGCACREGLSLYLAFPSSKRVYQFPVSPHLFTALRELFSEGLSNATERHCHPTWVGTSCHRPSRHPVSPLVCPEASPSLRAASSTLLREAGHGQIILRQYFRNARCHGNEVQKELHWG